VTVSPLYILIPETSALAARRTLSLRNLDQIPWILFARQIQPTLYDAIEAYARSAGVAASERHDVTSAEQAAQLIYRTGGAAILAKHDAWRVAMDGFTLRPLVEPEIAMRTVLAVRSDAGRVVSEFVRTTVREFRKLTPHGQSGLSLTA